MAWPPTISKGIVLAGFPCNSAGLMGSARGPSRLGEWTMSPEGLYATTASKQKRALRSPILVSFSYAQGWTSLNKTFSPPLESTIPILGGALYTWTSEGPVFEGEFQAEETDVYRLLLLDAKGKGYDQVLISEEKDASKPVAKLELGEWSDWIYKDFDTDEGQVEAAFRFKLLEISPDGSRFFLFRTQVFETGGWSYPGAMAKELVTNIGPFVAGYEASTSLRYDRDTFFEKVAYQAKYLFDAAKYLTKRHSWDLLITQIHVQDTINHEWLGYLHEGLPGYSSEKAEKGWQDQALSYQEVDEMIGNFVDEFLDEKTLLVVVSDHGGCPTWKTLHVGDILVHAGLLRIKWDEKAEKRVVDWSKTKTFFSPPNHIWINLKGRDPHGIVDPGEEYEDVREEVINTFYSIRDPETGSCPVAFVSRKEDALFMGQWGERDADILLFLKPGYASSGSPKTTHINAEDIIRLAEPHMLQKSVKRDFVLNSRPGCQHTHLPTARLGPFTNLAMFLIRGPGVKKGYERTKPMNLTDVVPTLCYMLGIPFPAHCEGKILLDMLET